MTSLRKRLQNGPALLADGAIGSLLIAAGLKAGECPEQLNLDQPDRISEIARRYAEAGAEMVQANTFGASPLKLANYGLEKRTAEINRHAVELARRGAGAGVYVYAAIGPCGKLLKPYGDAEPEAVFQSFLRQMRTLIEAGIDAFSIETMIDAAEAVLAVKAARSVSLQVPVMAALTFDSTPRGFYTVMGQTVAKAAAELSQAGADVIGSNCGNGSVQMVALAAEFRRSTALPLIIQPNAGLPTLEKGRVVYPETPAFMAEKAAELIVAGVRVIGGCCGTTPEHIHAIRAMLHTAA